MAAPETLAHQIRANIGTSLAAIAQSDTYHGPTPTVIHVDHFDRRYVQDLDGGRVFMVRDTSPEVRVVSASTYTQNARRLTVFVMLMEKMKDQFDPFRSTHASPGQRRDRMIADAMLKLYEDRKRGGLAIDTTLAEPERDFEEPLGWIVAELPVIVDYYNGFTTI